MRGFCYELETKNIVVFMAMVYGSFETVNFRKKRKNNWYNKNTNKIGSENFYGKKFRTRL